MNLHPLYKALDLAHDCGVRKGCPALTQTMLESILINLLGREDSVVQAVAEEAERFVMIHKRMVSQEMAV